MPKSFSAPDTHFRIIASETSVSNDGYRKGEPMKLECDCCGASVMLTPEPSPGIDELPHKPWCDQRFVESRWWQRNFLSD
ncbi:hypothetical protein ACFQJC_04865 [Haloferax namakaokahaiae]|uniref:Small CPxCG-related zinc finger protein n=1 Tax=Haloferax namakaokahaiae TaxID=1748331 RepID=A0ABD5ZC89_9EURY